MSVCDSETALLQANPTARSELDVLKQRITELEAELEKKNVEIFDLNNENQKLRKELESRIEELEKDRADSDAENIKRDAENAELKVRVAKLEQDSSVVDEQSQDAEDGKVFLLRGFKKLQCESTASLVSQNTASTTSTSSHGLKNEQGSSAVDMQSQDVPSEVETFLIKEHKKSASGRTPSVSQNTASVTSHERKKEQGLIQEMISSMEDVTEISANQVRPNNETSTERNGEQSLSPDIISLYETACGAEKKAIEANREETLRWCFYAREFKRMYKDFMVSNKVGEKKAKGQIYDFIIEQLPDTKRKTLCRQTQKALRIDDLFEKNRNGQASIHKNI